ncbi:hypothetical protein [Pontibacter anaerobius]|uniref:DUF4178 domain-containing protein n=1 Tax=Pontibacter anaerobius TaxID=2993940 RepID=A0ABT3RLE1_9BACT|nr:hypothetical protein [Pontibacter anaerobius]MCX2742209.1 hypothetical protein [Pontibacter anaerobius]
MDRFVILVFCCTVAILFISAIVYIQSEKFRNKRAKKLLTSRGFKILEELGFELTTVGSIYAFLGQYEGINFVIHIDSDDPFFESNFSLVFTVAYKDIDDKTLITLNEKYYSRFKTQLVNSEYTFLGRNYAQFRYAISPFKIGDRFVEVKMKYFKDLFETEELQRIEFEDVGLAISRTY